MKNQVSSRKSDHIRISLDEDVQSSVSTGLERYRFIHQALPEIDLEDVQLSQTIFGRMVRVPILISSMTGGTPEAAEINNRLATVAMETGAALGLGSQRAALEHPELAWTFEVRKFAPDILLLANIGAVQLNYSYSIEHCKRAVDMVGADALILHLNPLQEALQPEGDTRFSDLLHKIEKICRELPVPVVVKEVGWGISEKAASLLASAGVQAIDVAGAGGTSWSQVEMFRMKDEKARRIAAAFRNWGIPTAESIAVVRKVAPEMLIIGSGGLKDGVDIAKCIALGASLGGLAGLVLKAVVTSTEEAMGLLAALAAEVRICMFAVGAKTISDLRKASLMKDAERG
jgi:isopentenyl-diphosphate delta-isomerase